MRLSGLFNLGANWNTVFTHFKDKYSGFGSEVEDLLQNFAVINFRRNYTYKTLDNAIRSYLTQYTKVPKNKCQRLFDLSLVSLNSINEYGEELIDCIDSMTLTPEEILINLEDKGEYEK